MVVVMIFFSLSLVAHAAKRYFNYKATSVAEVKTVPDSGETTQMAPAVPRLGFNDNTGSWDVSGSSTTHVFQNSAADPGAGNLIIAGDSADEADQSSESR
jgi:hypothetical protein